jgi:hypothetical protein
MTNDKYGSGGPEAKPEEPDNVAGHNQNIIQQNWKVFNNNCKQQPRQNSRFEGKEPSLKGYIYR